MWGCVCSDVILFDVWWDVELLSLGLYWRVKWWKFIIRGLVYFLSDMYFLPLCPEVIMTCFSFLCWLFIVYSWGPPREGSIHDVTNDFLHFYDFTDEIYRFHDFTNEDFGFSRILRKFGRFFQSFVREHSLWRIYSFPFSVLMNRVCKI